MNFLLPIATNDQMRSIRCRHSFDSINTHLIVDHLHLLSLGDSDTAGVHPQEDAVLDDHLYSLLNYHTFWRKMTKGGGFQQKEFDIVNTNLEHF